ncbi:MAG: IPTL-CTERM sorting domain-containing protein [Pseudomonadota bacterium]
MNYTPTIKRAPLAAGIALALASGITQAATFTVTTSDDSGSGSLRQAITDANAAAGPHTIDMSAISGSMITLASDLPTMSEDTSILGNGTVLNGNGSYVCLYSTNGLSVDSMTVTNCVGDEYGGATFGGGIQGFGGSLTITDSTISNNTADVGGGIYFSSAAPAALTITNSTISGNTGGGSGGGITHNNSGYVVLTDTVISGNYSQGVGGAIESRTGKYSGGSDGITITDSTITGNTSVGNGGGLQITGGIESVEITGTTISNNSSGYDGGGFYSSGTFVSITNSTISGNTADRLFGGGYVYVDYGFADETFTMDGSTVSGNVATGAGGLGVSAYTSGTDGTGAIAIANSTFSGNTDQLGGSLYLRNDGYGYDYGDLSPSISHSTITGNVSSANAGGGIMMANQGANDNGGYAATPQVMNSIIQGNSSYTGSDDIDSDAAFVTVTQSNPFLQRFQMIADNPQLLLPQAPSRTGSLVNRFNDKPNAASITEQQIADMFAAKASTSAARGPNNVTFDVSYSIIGVAPQQATFNPDAATSANLGADPLLGPLQDNGGPTFTHLPGEGSPAYELIPDGTNGCGTDITDDQRGFGRPALSAGCTAGSVESIDRGNFVSVPTLNHLGTGLLALGLALMGWLGFRRRTAVGQSKQ